MFFGLEIGAPWPRDLPKGRVIAEESRHITLAFLGKRPYSEIIGALASCPQPAFRLAPIGKSDHLLFIPPRHPRVAAWHVEWLTQGPQLLAFHEELIRWLLILGYEVDRRELLSHVTVARGPFDPHEWKEAFIELPIVAKALHLYESVGNLTYEPKWSLSFLPPYEELDHTADIAFRVQADDLNKLYLHAQIALAFKYPPLLRYLSTSPQNSLDDIVASLNRLIATADAEIGIPFKAVSYHGTIKKERDNLLHWEMIVDV